MEDSLIFYEFSRSRVERRDFSHFLGLYSLDKLPTGRRLRTMMNSMIFCIAGYDDDPREIYAIPEVRRFYREFHKAWPYSLYFCNLDTDTFRSVAFCCIDNITAVAYEGQPESLVHYDRSGVVQFMSANFGAMNQIRERANMFESLIYQRTKNVFEYFGLPFNEPPPG